jgi:hypothetical protein
VGIADACLLDMERHAKHVAAQMDVLYIAVVEHRITKEKHVRYLETGKLQGKLAALLPFLTRESSSPMAEEARASSDPAPDTAAIPPPAPARNPSHDVLPAAAPARGVEPMTTTVSILSQGDIHDLLQQRAKRAHNVARLFKRLSSMESVVIQTNANLFIEEKLGSWELTTYLFVAENPSHSIVINVRSCVVDEDMLREHIVKAMADTTSSLTCEPLAYDRLSSFKFPAVEDVSLQEAMDFAAVFSSTADRGLQHAQTPTLRSGKIDLALRSDRTMLQFALRLRLIPEKALLMMLSRKMPPNSPQVARKTRNKEMQQDDALAHEEAPRKKAVSEEEYDTPDHALGPYDAHEGF